jgi:polysaccharide pyruvyl transferase WcaK-like protein
MTKNIVLWGAWYGSRNVGDQLLLLAISDILYNHVTNDIRFTVLTDNAPWIEEYTSQESQCDIVAIQSRQEINKVIKAVKNSDIFIIGGGVPFFEKTSHVFVMFFLISLVRIFGKPYLFWSVSSQVIQSKFALLVYRWILGGTTLITYRDNATQDLFASCGVQFVNMQHVPDSGFTLDWDQGSNGIEILKRAGWKPDDRPLVALTPRSLRIADGESETHYQINSYKQYQQEIDCYIAAYDWLWENGYQPIFIPMNTVAPDDDLSAARKIIARSKFGKHAFVIEESIRPRIAPGIYRQCLVSFVARVHGSITSMLGNCPMMMFSFAPKHAGIMEMMGMEDYILSLDIATPLNSVNMLEDLISHRESLQQKMELRLPELQKDALIPAHIIQKIFASK